MGGAPSRETLVRGIVREPHLDALRGDSAAPPPADAPAGLGPNQSAVKTQAGGTGGSGSKSQQPEIVLIPLIAEYFPNASCALFQQLLAVRREPSVMYYNRDSRTNAGGGVREDVMPDSAGSDTELYGYYMNLTEQRLVETDNDLVALHRSGRAYTPVPCAVAFVYDPTSTIPSLAAVANAAAGAACEEGAATAGKRGAKPGAGKKAGAQAKPKKGGAGGASGGGNSYMTLENTVRLPRQNLRVRVFGFIGDTRLSQPFMLPAVAAKSPVGLGLYLSKSAGGNHRTQVTLLAAYTYITQLRQAGVILSADFDLGKRQRLFGGSAGAADMLGSVDAYANTGSAYYGYGTGGSTADPFGLGAAGTGAVGGGDRIILGRAPSFGDYEDAYTQASTTANQISGNYLVAPVAATSATMDASNGFGNVCSGSPCGSPRRSWNLSQDELQLFLHPIAFSMHRSDIPALCYLREMRLRMADSAEQPQQAAAATATPLMHVDPATIRTSLSDSTLRGYMAAPDAARFVLWAAAYYAARLESLTGGEATRYRNLLAQRNLAENAVDGQVFVSAQDPATSGGGSSMAASLLLKPGDVWVTSEDTFVSSSTLSAADCIEFMSGAGVSQSRATYADPNSSSAVFDPSNGIDAAEVDLEGKWLDIPAGTVFRRTDEGQWSTHMVTPYTAHDDEKAPSLAGAAAAPPKEHVEDILLTLCRGACNDSRRASPTDPHWVVSTETGMPEGLPQGLLIWRDSCAGQSVFYGTTPDYLKKWLQANLDPLAEYVKLMDSLNPLSVAGGGELEGGTDRSSKAIAATSSSAAGEGADSSGRNSVAVAGTGSSTYSDSLLKQQDVKERGSSGSAAATGATTSKTSVSPISVYSVRTGFVRTPSDEARLKNAGLAVAAVPAAPGTNGGGTSIPKDNSDSARTPPKAIPVSSKSKPRKQATTAKDGLIELVEEGAREGATSAGASAAAPHNGSVSISDVYYRTTLLSSGESTPMYASFAEGVDGRRSGIQGGAMSSSYYRAGGNGKAAGATTSTPVRIDVGNNRDIPSSSSSDALATSFKQGGHSPSSAAKHGASLLRSTSWTDSTSDMPSSSTGGGSSPYYSTGKSIVASQSPPSQQQQRQSSVPVAVPARPSSIQVSNTKFSVGSASLAHAAAAAAAGANRNGGTAQLAQSPPQHQQRAMAASPPATAAAGSQRQHTGTLLSCSYTSTNRKHVLSASASHAQGGETLLGSSLNPPPTMMGSAAVTGTSHKSSGVKKMSAPQPQQPVMVTHPLTATATTVASATPSGSTAATHDDGKEPATSSPTRREAAATSSPKEILKRSSSGTADDKGDLAAEPTSALMSSSQSKKELHRPPPLNFTATPNSSPSPTSSAPAAVNGAQDTTSAPIVVLSKEQQQQEQQQQQQQQQEHHSISRSHHSHHHLPEPQQPVRASLSLPLASADPQSLLGSQTGSQPHQLNQPQPPPPQQQPPPPQNYAYSPPHPRFSQPPPPPPQYLGYPYATDTPPSDTYYTHAEANNANNYDAAVGGGGCGSSSQHHLYVSQHTPTQQQPPSHHRQPSGGSSGAYGSYPHQPPQPHSHQDPRSLSPCGAPLTHHHHPSLQQPQQGYYAGPGGGVGSGTGMANTSSTGYASTQGGSMRIPIVRKGIDDADAEDNDGNNPNRGSSSARLGGQQLLQGTPTRSADGSFRPSSARSSVGNGRYRWDWRATTPTLSSSFQSSSVK